MWVLCCVVLCVLDEELEARNFVPDEATFLKKLGLTLSCKTLKLFGVSIAKCSCDNLIFPTVVLTTIGN